MDRPADRMRVRLIKKFAECINGIDLAGRTPGDVLELPDAQAYCLIAEGWAVVEKPPGTARVDDRPRARPGSRTATASRSRRPPRER